MTGPLTDPFWKLLDGLTSKSKANALDWVASDDFEDFYEIVTTRSRILVGSRDGDGEPPYEVIIVKPNSTDIVETISGAGSRSEESAEVGRIITELYHMARRKALGVEDAVKAALKDLGID